MAEAAPTDEQQRHFCYHWPNSDPALVAPDLEMGQPFTDTLRGDDATPWGSATIPLCAVTMMGERAVAKQPAAIDVPVLIACGERDVFGDLWGEPAGYQNSSAVSRRVIPRIARMHNFADTRGWMWDAIEHFASDVRTISAAED